MAQSIVIQYYDALKKGILIAHKCKKCGEHTFPPTTMCAHCGSSDQELVEISGKGKLEYVSHGASPPPHPRFTSAAPYAFGHIRLNEGIYIQGIVTNIDISPKTLAEYYNKGPVAVKPNIKTYDDDLPVLSFEVE